MTVAQARAEFLQRKKDISDVDAIVSTFLKWCNYVNRYAYRQMTNIMPESFILVQSYATVAGTASYTLPTAFQDIIPQGTGLYEVNDSGVATDNRLATTNYASAKVGFYINATSLVFTPIPTGVKNYNFRYIPLLTDLTTETGATGTFVIPTRFSEHIMNALDCCYNIWDEEQNAEIFNDERFIRTMEEFVSLMKPDAQVLILPDFMEAYY